MPTLSFRYAKRLVTALLLFLCQANAQSAILLSAEANRKFFERAKIATCGGKRRSEYGHSSL